MESYTNGEFVFTKVATKGGWTLFKGKGPKYSIYELVMLENGALPCHKKWGKKGFTFLGIEDALRAMKALTKDK